MKKLKSLLAVGGIKTSHTEKIVSGVGGFIALVSIFFVTSFFVPETQANLIVASMGASAVLLFAVPHGPLSQPWALIVGHLLSAFIGVSCYLLIPNLYVAAAIAVGLAISSMYYLRCLHPPGGATALTAVVAGNEVHQLGYSFLFLPVLVNVLVIFAVAVFYNYFFKWRRYPVSLMAYHGQLDKTSEGAQASLSRQDLQYALEQMNLYIDIEPEELVYIYQLAQNQQARKLGSDDIKLGRYYSNGKYGSNWSIRQIVDESGDSNAEKDQVIYKVAAGKDRRNSGVMKRSDFAAWAEYEVFLNENSWQRVSSATNKLIVSKTE